MRSFYTRNDVIIRVRCDFVCSESVTLGVVGVDVPYSSLYNFLTTQFELCRLSSSE